MCFSYWQFLTFFPFVAFSWRRWASERCWRGHFMASYVLRTLNLSFFGNGCLVYSQRWCEISFLGQTSWLVNKVVLFRWSESCFLVNLVTQISIFFFGNISKLIWGIISLKLSPIVSLYYLFLQVVDAFDWQSILLFLHPSHLRVDAIYAGKY